MTHPEFLSALQALLGTSAVLTDPADLAPYCLDQRRRYRGQALALAANPGP